MNKTRILSIFIALILVVTLGFVVVSPVHATTIKDTGIVKSGETVDDDLLLGGQTVQMDGTVNGILIAAGNTVTITGTVNGDLITGGQTVVISDTAVITGNVFSGAQNITVNGKVEGSLFTGASQLVLGSTASVGRNVYFGGYSFSSQNGSTIGTDFRAGAYQTILNGSVGQDAVINAGAVELNGKIGHNAELWLSDSSANQNSGQYMPGGFVAAVAPGLRVSPSAQISGKLIYTSAQQYTISPAPTGGIVHNLPAAAPQAKFGPGLVSQETGSGFKVWHALSSLITLLLCGALAVGLFGKCFGDSVAVAEKRTLASAGVGLLVIFAAIPAFLLAVMVIVLVGLILSFISLGGLAYPIFGLGLGALGLAATALIVLISVVSKLIVSYLIGTLIFKATKTNLSGEWAKALPLLVGVVVYVIVAALPFVGWLFSLIATIIGVGAVWFWLFPGKPAVNPQPPLPLMDSNVK